MAEEPAKPAADGSAGSGSAWDGSARRRVERFDLKAPLDVTILRSGIPDTVPGRTVDASENGLAAMLAGELTPGETVGLQIQLPAMAGPLRTRAKVKYQDKLRCGLEFLWLSAEERAAIRDSAMRTKSGAQSAKPVLDSEEKVKTGREEKRKKSGRSGDGGGGDRDGTPGSPAEKKTAGPEGAGREGSGSKGAGRKRWIAAGIAFVLLVAAAAGALWWKWQRSWENLENGLKNHQSAALEKPEAQVAADVMEKLLVHRVEPVYPPEARQGNVQGVIALDIVINRDGAVASMRPLNGPDMLARAAMDALRWWRFEPYRINGEPAVVETTVAVEFKR
jgi:TonB family protein